jgi:hypothetical protein
MIEENLQKMKKSKLLFISAICMAVIQSNASLALDTALAQSAIDDGVVLLEAQQDVTGGGWGDSDGLNYVYTASAVEALHSANQRTGAYYSGIAWIENHNANNTDLEARKIMALVDHGNNIDPDLALVHAGKRETTQTGWGLNKAYYSSPLETAFVLKALYEAGDATGQISAIDYLLAKQLSDGGWGFAETNTAQASDLWITSEVVIALANHQAQTGVSSTLSSAITFLATINTANASASTLARVALGRYAVNGLDSSVDSLLWDLMGKQVTAGNWGNVLGSANSVTTLSHVMGLTAYQDSARVSIEDEQLRIAINRLLGHADYGQLTQADINRLTHLDLTGLGINDLTGLEYASNLIELKVDPATDISAVLALSDLNIIGNETDPVIERILFSEALALVTDSKFVTCLNSQDVTYADEVINIDCRYKSISSLDGIGSFTSLGSLNLYSNLLTSVDLSLNLKLKDLNLDFNKLTSIDVKELGDLESLSLYGSGNAIYDLDLSSNLKLMTLNMGFNKLSSLDVSGNINLTYIKVYANQLSDIDFSKNINLMTIRLENNNLTSLDLSKNTKLVTVDISRNDLVNLDVSNNKNLDLLYLYSNKLTSINLNSSTVLTNLSLEYNQLTSIGLSYNTELTTLNLERNELASIDVSKNVKLTSLKLERNLLTSLDVRSNVELTLLGLQRNQLTGMDLSANTKLKSLYLSRNELVSLDLNRNTSLRDLNLDQNKLINLDVSTNVELTALRVYSNQLSNIDVSNNRSLYQLYVDRNQLTSAPFGIENIFDHSAEINLRDNYFDDNAKLELKALKEIYYKLDFLDEYECLNDPSLAWCPSVDPECQNDPFLPGCPSVDPECLYDPYLPWCSNEDTDSDGEPNHLDTDDDGDLVLDVDDAFPLDPTEDTDTDGDGHGDNSDAFINNASEWNDSDADGMGDNYESQYGLNNAQTDSAANADIEPDNLTNLQEFELGTDPTLTDTDGDGISDDMDSHPLDPTLPEIVADADGDGIADSSDAFVNNADASVDADGDGLPDAWNVICDVACQAASSLVLDTSLDDFDNDGVVTANDAFPTDALEWSDTDGDNVGDNSDAFVNNADASVDADDDGLPDAWNASCGVMCQTASSLLLDTSLDDFDNDGVVTANDAFPTDASEWTDTDGDNVGDNSDAFVNNATASMDTDGDGYPDTWNDGCDLFCQNSSGLELDALPESFAAHTDTDGDGYPDAWNESCDSSCQITSNLELDALPENLAAYLDADGDGYPDAWNASCDVACQTASNLVLDTSLDDFDNDGVVTANDAFPTDASEWTDTDGDNVGDNSDAFINNLAASIDADGDGLPDAWNMSCDSTCQINSSLVLDLLLDDRDNDYVVDSEDAFPDDPTEYADSDLDGTGDNSDAFVNNADASVDADVDGLADAWNASCDVACQTASSLALDTSLDDFDNDGVITANDAFPTDASEWTDTDGDGFGDNIEANNSRPLAAEFSVNLLHNTALTQIDLSNYVSDENLINWSSLQVTLPTYGAVIQNGETLSVIDFDYSASDYAGEDAITFSVEDALGLRSNVATVSLVVAGSPSTSVITDMVISSDLPASQQEGAVVTFTLSAQGGSGNYEYKLVQNDYDEGINNLLQDWSSNDSIVWDTNGHSGSNFIRVYARNVGETEHFYKYISYHITTSIDALVLTSDKSSPQLEGASVVFTLEAQGGSGNYEYKFIQNDYDEGIHNTLQDWSANDSVVWDSTGHTGDNFIKVYARNIGDTVYKRLSRSFYVTEAIEPVIMPQEIIIGFGDGNWNNFNSDGNLYNHTVTETGEVINGIRRFNSLSTQGRLQDSTGVEVGSVTSLTYGNLAGPGWDANNNGTGIAYGPYTALYDSLSGAPKGTTVSFSVNGLDAGVNYRVNMSGAYNDNTNVVNVDVNGVIGTYDSDSQNVTEYEKVITADNNGKLVITLSSDGTTAATNWGISYVHINKITDDTVADIPVASTFTIQPLSTAVTQGADATFTVAATGSYSIQWYRDGEALDGETTLSYTLTTSSGDDGAMFTAIANNPGGATSSNAATLSLLTDMPSISVQPVNSLSIIDGDLMNLSVTAIGAVSYQWQQDGADILGENNAVLSTGVTMSDTGSFYTVTVTNPFGYVTSSGSTLTVTELTQQYWFSFGRSDGKAAYYTDAFTSFIPDVKAEGYNGEDINFIRSFTESPITRSNIFRDTTGRVTDLSMNFTNTGLNTDSINGWGDINSDILLNSNAANTLITHNWFEHTNLYSYYLYMASNQTMELEFIDGGLIAGDQWKVQILGMHYQDVERPVDVLINGEGTSGNMQVGDWDNINVLDQVATIDLNGKLTVSITTQSNANINAIRLIKISP